MINRSNGMVDRSIKCKLFPPEEVVVFAQIQWMDVYDCVYVMCFRPLRPCTRV